MKTKVLLLLLALGFVATEAAPASACHVIRRTADGENICMTTSDSGGRTGKGDVYDDARPWKPKAVQAMEIARARQRRQEIREYRREHGNWR